MALRVGRKGWVGVGIETTPGSPVAITDYIPFTENTLKGQATKLEDDAARGRRARVSDSVNGQKWSEGDLTINVDPTKHGLFLYGALGSVNSSTVSGSVKDHTFSVNDDNPPKSLTVVNDRGVDREYFTGVAVKTYELSISDGLASVKNSLIGKFPITTASGTNTTASGGLYSFADSFFAFGADLSSAAAADNLRLSDFKLTIENNTVANHRHGSNDAYSISHGELDVTGEGTLFFEGTTQRDAYYANTKKSAVQKLTGRGLAGGYNESVTYNLSRIRLDTFELETGLSDFFAEKFNFIAEVDETDGSVITAVVRNIRSSY